jgi:hypothetical protein
MDYAVKGHTSAGDTLGSLGRTRQQIWPMKISLHTSYLRRAIA